MKQQILALIAFAMVALLSACSSTGGSSAGTANSTTNAVAQANEEDPLICENYIPSGTRIARKVCIRQSEKDRIQEQAQTITQENQRRAVIGSPTGND
ncbi:hypothetical protein R0137_11220 [Congregibacter brevis]|uniref:Uncharacterized protein n=1 Tax=Congregibacter brevis TaxID=3081201 RepID=A0ABZ0IAS5_9GAMM|nr:hypothetical protein R0137_11220 [Congregibacter sp. IMCC45268]